MTEESARDQHLAGCAAQDLNKQIASELGISEMTAKIHRVSTPERKCIGGPE
jgi:FixJ family two-component response regulator